MSLKTKINEIFNRTYKEQCDGQEPEPLTDETVLLETGLDSLGFAILVVNLEIELEYDPFVLSEDPFYPTTFKEFVDFYETNRPV